uniref:uncharacterized protein LOC118555194 n=1 Tax=Halichoerus grypus TaxID=9711 RepID=UPI0016590227|nr:uncharacterized protein LOC118555194 [Halichoerus grypus]
MEERVPEDYSECTFALRTSVLPAQGHGQEFYRHGLHSSNFQTCCLTPLCSPWGAGPALRAQRKGQERQHITKDCLRGRGNTTDWPRSHLWYLSLSRMGTQPEVCLWEIQGSPTVHPDTSLNGEEKCHGLGAGQAAWKTRIRLLQLWIHWKADGTLLGQTVAGQTEMPCHHLMGWWGRIRVHDSPVKPGQTHSPQLLVKGRSPSISRAVGSKDLKVLMEAFLLDGTHNLGPGLCLGHLCHGGRPSKFAISGLNEQAGYLSGNSTRR